jgi:hypothetical protein
MIKTKQMLLCLFITVLISGCSFRFIYNHLDWWTNWYLDDYVSLSKQQQKLFDNEFEQLHLWHRKTQLPLYTQQLKALKSAINKGIDEKNIADNVTKFTSHWKNFLIAAEPKLQPLVFSFTPQQKQQLLQALKAGNQERIDDHEKLTDQQWFDEKAEEQQDQLKEWFGKLTKTQKAAVAKMSQNFQRSFQPWINYRQRWTNQFAALLNGNLPDHQFKFEFYRLFVTGRSLRDEAFNDITAHNSQVFAKIFVYMTTNATDKQRKRINKKLNKVIGDLEYLTHED